LNRRRVKLKSGSKTDRGRIRENNEDSFYADNNVGLFIIADGMGGQNAGEVASQMAVKSLSQRLSEKLGAMYSPGQGLQEAEIENIIRTNLLHANKKIREVASTDSDLAEMGTTAVLAICLKDVYYIANVGDSRAYSWNTNHELKRLTEDHTLENKMKKMGYGEMEFDPRYKHILTRWLGSPMIQADLIDIRKGSWHQNDCLLLCSDGLTNMLTDTEISTIIRERMQEGSQAVCEFLVKNGILKGGHDNITTILVQNEI
jgi:serine/threonine protein phosphatase PrpC